MKLAGTQFKNTNPKILPRMMKTTRKFERLEPLLIEKENRGKENDSSRAVRSVVQRPTWATGLSSFSWYLYRYCFYQKHARVTALCVLGNKLLNIQFAKYHIWNNKSEGFPNMVLSAETFNQSIRTEYSEAVNARYTFQPLWVSVFTLRSFCLFSQLFHVFSRVILAPR